MINKITDQSLITILDAVRSLVVANDELFVGDRWNLQTMLQKNLANIGYGNVILGGGAYAFAMQITDDLVLKTNVGHHYKEFDGQYAWLKWCAENQHNRFVPKITYLDLICEKEGRYVVIMEKLYQDFTNNMISIMSTCIRDGVNTLSEINDNNLLSERQKYMSIKETSSKINPIGLFYNRLKEYAPTLPMKIDRFEKNAKKSLDYMKSYVHPNNSISEKEYELETYSACRNMIRWHQKTNGKKNRNLNIICREIVFLAEKYESPIDIHSGNIMIRKDGTPVVVDPIAGQ